MRVDDVENSLSTVLENNKTSEIRQPQETNRATDFFQDLYYKLPPMLLTGAAFFGCLTLLIWILQGFVNKTKWTFVISVILFLCSALAALTVYGLQALSDQIRFLRMIRIGLSRSVDDMEDRVNVVQKQNKEMGSNLDVMQEQNRKMDELQAHLEESNFDIEQDIKRLNDANDSFQAEVKGLNKANEKLDDTLLQMTKNHEELSEALQQFDELQDQLSQFAEDSGMEMTEILDDFHSKFGKMEKMMTSNEEQLLHQMAYKAERRDRKSGLGQNEYKRFVAHLPRRYRSIMEKDPKKFSFATLMDQGSRNSGIDSHEIVDLLLEESDKREMRELEA